MGNALKFFAGVMVGAAVGAVVTMVMMSSMYEQGQGGLAGRIAGALSQGQEDSKKKEAEMWAKFRAESKIPVSRTI